MKVYCWDGRVVKASDLNEQMPNISLGVSPRRFKSCSQRIFDLPLVFLEGEFAFFGGRGSGRCCPREVVVGICASFLDWC